MSQELADRAAIVDAVIAYATALDTRDWATLGSLFTDDARWEYAGSGERLSGPDAIVARISASLERFDATHHLPGGEKFLSGGRYDDRLRRTPDGWQFTHRRITSVWSEGNPAVITS